MPLLAFLSKTLRRSLVLSILSSSVVVIGVVWLWGSRSAAAGSVTIRALAPNHSSVRIYFDGVDGARDYRVYDLSNPNEVKYAGLRWEYFPFPMPSTQIDWNLVGDGQPHTLVVEAVDLLGPVPLESLYDSDTNMPLLNNRSPGAMLGANKGRTLDGKISTNGQGPYTNNPQIISRSDPFVVQADRKYQAIPSIPSATSTFFDTFDNSEASTMIMGAMDPRAGTMRFAMNAGTSRSATIQYQEADVQNSMPFISADHFMDVLFDGGTPGTNLPLHQGHAVMAYSPDAIAPWSSGQALHVTQEVDGHKDSRRWVDIVVAPANDPVLAFDPETTRVNQSNAAVFLELFQGEACTLDIYTGSAAGSQLPTGRAGGSNGARLWGSAGQAPVLCEAGPWNGLGFDVKSRYDFFLTQTHAALFVNGRLIVQSDIPVGTFGWANQPVKIYFSHYVYHTDNDIDDLRTSTCGPMNAYWFNDPVRGTQASQNACRFAYPPGYGFPRSDERHWDNLGFELLPAALIPEHDFSLAWFVVQPPAIRWQ